MSTELTNWISFFSDPTTDSAGDAKTLLGGKGASLKDMARAGLAVPPGFTITTEACKAYYELERTWPAGLEEQVRANLARLERETGRTFGRGQRPLLVSVRSGAAVSMPGMMDTILNCGLCPALAEDLGDTPEFWNLYLQFIGQFTKTVHAIDHATLAEAAGAGHNEMASRGLAERYLAAYAKLTGKAFPTTPWEALKQCIDAVFASWLSERAIVYRKHHEITGLAGTAVNVQQMFPSEVSGVIFTKDPNDLAANRMVIEASYGLGEAVVSGDVTPDRFLIHRESLAIEATIGNKHAMVRALGSMRKCDPKAPSLTEAQLRELTKLALKVEKHFGHPLDIEFGFADERFALLQSRRIRGLDIAEDVEPARQADIARLKAKVPAAVNGKGAGRKAWIIHNLAETLRYPTPLTWDILRAFMSGSGGFGRMYRDLGYRPSERVSKEGFLELICGTIYADPDVLAELFWDGIPLTYDLEALLADKSLLDSAPTKFDANRADGRFLRKLPGTMVAMFRASRAMKRARRKAKRHFEQTILPPYLTWVKAEHLRDLRALSDDELIALLHERRRKTLDEFGPESLKPGFFGGIALDALKGMLCQLMGENEGGELARTLTRALEGDTTIAQDTMLYKIAMGQASLEEFLRDFGHRCVGEMELARPRWREDPAYPQQIIDQFRANPGRSPEQIHEENLHKRQQAEAKLPETLAKWGGASFLEQIREDLADAQALLPYREAGKHYLMMGYELIRQATEELARRWNMAGNFYFLHLEELATHATAAAEVGKRRTRWQALQRLDSPDVIDSDKLENLGLAQQLDNSSMLKGTAVASGVSTGPARIVFNPQEAKDLGTDYILVCPSTDPGWTPLFLHARGLIVERGGVLSHGAIVARDFGIPAVVCPSATKLIKSGERITVDGNNGRVLLLDKQAAEATEALK